MTVDIRLLDFLDHYSQYIGPLACVVSALCSGVVCYLLGRLRTLRKAAKYVDKNYPTDAPHVFITGYLPITHEPIEAEFYRAEYVKRLKAELATLRWRHEEVKKGHEARMAAARELMKTAGRKREEEPR